MLFDKTGHANCGQEINVQNINVELIARLFENYQSNVLFHLEGSLHIVKCWLALAKSTKPPTN